MALAVVGGAFLSASLQVLFDRLASRDFINFFSGRKNEEKLLKNLKIMLLRVQPLLDDAELKQFTNTAVKDWVDELKDTIYHADDLLDEINTKAMQSNLLRFWSQFAEDITSRIKETIQKLEYFVDAKDSLGLREVVVGRNISSHRLPTTSLVDHVSVYGRNYDKDTIIQLYILDDESSGPPVSVIPIIGMGGIGKTTLAQLVYNDPQVVNHFEAKIWVCVSEEFDIVRVTKTILVGLSVSISSDDDLNTLQVKLSGGLAEKKFLIVLDDVWNEKYENWDQLKRPFAVGKRGSKIIVTTRNKGVASVMQTFPIFDLELLSNEDCWLLFSEHAFVNVSDSVRSSLEPIGKKIVEKCKGLPLAAKTLGGLLRYKVEVKEWENVLNSDFWDLPKEKSDILPALLLSYQHLPSYLKQCFAFCAIIPKHYKFRKDQLLPLWIAGGFVEQPRANRRIEEIGDGYFRELISRSLFQQVCNDDDDDDDDKFLMHDLINDLAQFVAGKYCFRLGDDQPDFSKVRYFSYFQEHGFDAFRRLQPINEANYLIRIFQCFVTEDENVLLDVLLTLRRLRVLSLIHYPITELPDSIGELIHLRYLDLSLTNIKCLPETISRLYNLETLLLRDCRCLASLPGDFCKLIRLRHLDISGTKLRALPMQFGRLRSLQCLTNFIVGNQTGSAISELRELDQLRGTLSISNLRKVLISEKANLISKKHLKKLNLVWGAEPTFFFGERVNQTTEDPTDDSQKEKERVVLEKLQPHIDLKHLTIESFGGKRFPEWLGDCSFSNLKSLRLRSCTYCDQLPPLGQLTSLQELTIEGMNSLVKVGSEFYGHDSVQIKPFQSLEKLTFLQMSEWEEWSILGAGEFCKLVDLCIAYCPKLSCEFPKHLPFLEKLNINGCQSLLNLDGLQNLSSLKSLSINDCPNMVSIGGGGLPAPNLTRISINSCKKLKALPEQMCTLLPSLQELNLTILPEIESFPSGGLPNSLSSLDIVDCDKLMACRKEWGLQRLPSLRTCFIQGECEEDKLLESFPEDCLLPTSLTTLHIWKRPNMKSLNPNGFRHLNSLKDLTIWDCPELQSLPNEKLPSSLVRLHIHSCPLLKVRCQRVIGADWPKISHIPSIWFDNKENI